MSSTPESSSPAPAKKRTEIKDQPIDDAAADGVVGGGAMMVPCIKIIVPCVKIPDIKPGIRGA